MQRTQLDEFTNAYFDAALWAGTDDAGNPLDDHYKFEDIDGDSVQAIVAECQEFIEIAAHLIEGEESQAGHDFLLTRNGHGAGFWDGDWPKDSGERLTALSKKYGESSLYVGDDGQLYVY